MPHWLAIALPMSGSAIPEAELKVSLTPMARPRSAGVVVSASNAVVATFPHDQPMPTRNVPAVISP